MNNQTKLRYLEIILKIVFLIESVYSIISETIPHTLLVKYLIITLGLGVVLIINKKSSYNFKQTKKDLVMRKIEGTLLIVFAIFIYMVQGIN